MYKLYCTGWKLGMFKFTLTVLIFGILVDLIILNIVIATLPALLFCTVCGTSDISSISYRFSKELQTIRTCSKLKPPSTILEMTSMTT